MCSVLLLSDWKPKLTPRRWSTSTTHRFVEIFWCFSLEKMRLKRVKRGFSSKASPAVYVMGSFGLWLCANSLKTDYCVDIPICLMRNRKRFSDQPLVASEKSFWQPEWLRQVSALMESPALLIPVSRWFKCSFIWPLFCVDTTKRSTSTRKSSSQFLV